MKQQTFLVKLLDNNNNMINFERFADKRIATVKSKIKKLYSPRNEWYFLYKKDIEKSSYIVFYDGKDNEKLIELERYDVLDFIA